MRPTFANINVGTLLDGAIPAMIAFATPALVGMLRSRKAKRRKLDSRVTVLEEALLGTKDMRGRAMGDGLLDRFDAMKSTLDDVQVGVNTLLQNGHS